MNVLRTTPTATRQFDMNIAAALGDINAAVIVQQLNYWMEKEGVGVIIDGVKYIYNTFNQWVNSQFCWLSIWQFRKSMSLLRQLGIVKVIRYREREWNQTNYYTLDKDRLLEIVYPKKAESTETVEMRATTDRDAKTQQNEMCSGDISYKESKTTSKEKTTNNQQRSPNINKRLPNNVAAASKKTVLRSEETQEKGNCQEQEFNTAAGQNQTKLKDTQKVDGENKNDSECSIKEVKLKRVINPQWRSQIEELDNLGVEINKTITNLVKMYSGAIRCC